MLCWYKIENRNFTDLDRDKKNFRQSNLDIGQTLYFYQCDNSRQHSRSCFPLCNILAYLSFVGMLVNYKMNFMFLKLLLLSQGKVVLWSKTFCCS